MKMKMIKLIILLILMMLFVLGCAKEPEPEVIIVEEPEPEPEPEPEIIEEPIEEVVEEPKDETRVIVINTTEVSFEPSQIELVYNERVKLVFISEHEHNIYAPGLKMDKPVKVGETEIYIPTDRKGSYNFWCNMLHFGSQHARMKGRINIE